MTPTPESSNESPSPRTDDQILIDWLRDRDVFCPLCNYNVRNLTSPRCPECGNKLRITIAIVDPYLKAWIALMVGVCAGAGIGILCLYAAFRGGLEDAPAAIRATMIIEILMIPEAVLVLFFRKKFQRLSRPAQWLLASVGIGLVLFGYVSFFASIP
jgi:hypothetical protein